MAQRAFCEFCKEKKIKYFENEPMCQHTSFKTGGNADIFVKTADTSELSSVLNKLCELNLPYFIIGKGSNLLVSDRGIDGAVVSLSDMDKITVEGECITAGAGASLAAVCVAALKNSLTGLEQLYGIPASVGGALYMNAGAYGGEMSQTVESAQFIDENLKVQTINNEDMHLGYRTSVFKNKKCVITSVTFKLKKGNEEDIRLAMDDYMERRKSKQPLEYPSAGSTFKRPEGYFAGALIEGAGLKGLAVGGAQVSPLHAGFIVNTGGATVKDIEQLMHLVQNTVYDESGVMLMPEVRIIGKTTGGKTE